MREKFNERLNGEIDEWFKVLSSAGLLQSRLISPEKEIPAAAMSPHRFGRLYGSGDQKV
jgi:hypothetical protein